MILWFVVKYISGVCSVPGTGPLKIPMMRAIKMSLVVLLFGKPWRYWRGFPGVLVVKKPPANARDVGLIPGSRRSPGRGMATRSSALAWRIPGTEEPGGLLSMELQSWTWLKWLSIQRTKLPKDGDYHQMCLASWNLQSHPAHLWKG